MDAGRAVSGGNDDAALEVEAHCEETRRMWGKDRSQLFLL